jgi:hypothetical protein
VVPTFLPEAVLQSSNKVQLMISPDPWGRQGVLDGHEDFGQLLKKPQACSFLAVFPQRADASCSPIAPNFRPNRRATKSLDK